MAGGIAGEAIKIGQAIKQKKLAKEFEKEKRPDYFTPGQVKESTGLARGAFMDPYLSGQKIAEESISGTTASGVRAAREAATGSAGLLATLGGLQQGEQQARSNLSISAAQEQERDRRGLQQSLLTEAGFAEKEFDINRMQPYLEKARAAGALREASTRNLYGGVRGVTGAMAGGAFAANRMINPGEEPNAAFRDPVVDTAKTAEGAPKPAHGSLFNIDPTVDYDFTDPEYADIPQTKDLFPDPNKRRQETVRSGELFSRNKQEEIKYGLYPGY